MNHEQTAGRQRRQNVTVLRYLTFFSIISSFLLAALRILELIIGLKDLNGFYTGPAALRSLGLLILVLLVAAVITVCVRQRKQPLPTELPACDTPLLFGSVLTAFLLLAYLFFRPRVGKSLAVLAAARSGAYLPTLLSTVFAPLAAAYFLLYLFRSKPDKRLACYLSFEPILFLDFFLMGLYFDTSCALSNPSRIGTHMSVCFSLLYFAAESRMLASEPKPVILVMTGCLSVIVGVSSALPTISLSFILNKPMNLDSLYAGIEIGILVYTVSRLNTLLRLRKSSEPPAEEEKTESAE